MSANTNLPRNVVAPRKTVVSAGFGGAAVVQLPPKPLQVEAPPAQQSEPSRLSEKEKLEKRLFQNEITAERADKIKSAFVFCTLFVAFQPKSFQFHLDFMLATHSLNNFSVSKPFLRALSC